MNLPGNAPTVTLFDGPDASGSPIGNASAVNGQVQAGPVYTFGSEACTISVTGADPMLPFSGQISGMQSDDPNDLSAVSGPNSFTIGVVQSYDGQTLIAEDSALGNSAHAADITYPSTSTTFDVHNWASVLLGLRMNTAAAGKSVLITFRWFANANGSRLIGQESMMLDDFVVTAVATLPNLGPFLQVVVNRLPGTGTWDWNASLLTSQRIVPNIYGGNFTPFLMELINQSIAGGANFTNPLGTLYAGPVWLAYRATGGQPGTFRIDSLSTDGTYHTGNVFQDSLATGNVNYKAAMLPSAPCRINISNTGAGVGTFTFNVFSSVTGSS